MRTCYFLGDCSGSRTLPARQRVANRQSRSVRLLAMHQPELTMFRRVCRNEFSVFDSFLVRDQAGV